MHNKWVSQQIEFTADSFHNRLDTHWILNDQQSTANSQHSTVSTFQAGKRAKLRIVMQGKICQARTGAGGKPQTLEAVVVQRKRCKLGHVVRKTKRQGLQVVAIEKQRCNVCPPSSAAKFSRQLFDLKVRQAHLHETRVRATRNLTMHKHTGIYHAVCAFVFSSAVAFVYSRKRCVSPG
jgi:hypothetical protein